MRTVPILLLLLALSACTHRVTDFTVLSTKNFEASRASDFVRGEEVRGEDNRVIILFFPTGVPSVKEAIDRAIESVPGAVALVDGVVYQQGYWFILGGDQRFIVEGNVLIDPKLRDALPKRPAKTEE